MNKHTPILPIPVLLSTNGWEKATILASNESLVALSPYSPQRIMVRPMYFLLKVPGAISECYVRESVARKLVEAIELLPPSLQLVIWDAWRPTEVQAQLYNAHMSILCRQHPDWSPDVLAKETARHVSRPSTNIAFPSPHLTGGAVDLTLANESGEVDMGTEFDAFEDNAQTRYFENMIAQGQRLSPKEETAAENRRLLFHVLTSVGFTNHLEEWWHYDFGNQFWGCIKKQPAIYGPIMDLSSVRS